MFDITLQQMAMMFSLVILGYTLRKCNILPEKSDVFMSRLEIYAFLPALNFYNQLTNCTFEKFKENYLLMFYGLLLAVIMVLISYPLSKCFVNKNDKNQYTRNIYKYAIAFANYGFMGNFIVLSIWGDEALFRYSMFTFLMTILCNIWGLYTLIPKSSGEKSLYKNIKNAVLKPPTIALFLGMIFGLMNIEIPDFLLFALKSASDCMGPVAMILTGVVIGGYHIKELVINKKVYIITLLRLVVIPLLMLVILKFLNINDEICIFTLIAFGAPLGLNTVIFPASFGGETKTGASMAMVSTFFSVITIPLIYLVFFELL